MIREKIVNEILQKLQNNDQNIKVFEWLNRPLVENEYPAVVVRDSEDNINDENVLEHNLKIEIDIVTKGDKSINEIRKLISFVLKTLENVENELNYEIRYSSSEIITEQKDFLYTGARCEFIVKYFTPRFEQ